LHTWFLSNSPAAFAKDEDFVTRNVEFLQCLANNFFGSAIAISIGRVPGVETTVVGSFEEL
jgi:hypothetical protein